MKDGVKHFVSPKKTDELDDEHVILKTDGITTEQFTQMELAWEGGEQHQEANKVKVSRNAVGKTEVRLRTKDGTVIDEMFVWIVWCDTAHTGNIQSNVSVNNQPGIGAVTTVISGIQHAHSIQPASILSDNDRPNLEGAKTSDPPGGNHPLFTTTKLKDGANNKWDASRRLRVKFRNPNNLPADAFSQPSPLITVNDFPTDPVEGNDDKDVSDEHPNPQTPANDPDEAASGGKLWSTDKVSISISKGNVGDTFELHLQFEEFPRVEINGKWYRIGDYAPWR